MLSNIVVISHKWLTNIIKKIEYKTPDNITIKTFEETFQDALNIALKLEKEGKADVFISAGGNARTLSQYISTPLVEITITGFDFLNALSRIMDSSSKTAVIVHKKNHIRYLDDVLDTIKFEVFQRTYETENELKEIISELKSNKIHNIIGTSLVVENAISMGMNAQLIYSEDGVRRAIDTAVGIIQAKETEAQNAKLLKTVIENIYGGILMVDSNGKIMEFNNNAEVILGIEKNRVVGENVNTVFPSMELSHVIETKKELLNQIKKIRDVRVLLNCVPIVLNEKLSGVVVTFQHVSSIQESDREIRTALYQKGFVAKSTFNDIHGRSEVINKTKEIAALYAKSLSTIMLKGESGTGKEIFAQAIHNGSARKNRPFVAINCAALPEQLLQSELFGYEEGSFTGARKGGKPGLFEMADKGTIFLDEIGEIHKTTQALLLRVLETREVMRLGGEKIVPVDIRVICATNKNLWQMVLEDKFREDLYYRLCVLEIDIPPLRHRKMDIPTLGAHLLKKLRSDLPETTIQEILNNYRFIDYDWPGNVRELRNLLERFAALFVKKKTIDDVLDILFNEKAHTLKMVDEVEDDEVVKALKKTRGNRKKAAELLGISRSTLWRKMNKTLWDK